MSKKCVSSVSVNLQKNERENIQKAKFCGLSSKTWIYYYNYQSRSYVLN